MSCLQSPVIRRKTAKFEETRGKYAWGNIVAPVLIRQLRAPNNRHVSKNLLAHTVESYLGSDILFVLLLHCDQSEALNVFASWQITRAAPRSS